MRTQSLECRVVERHGDTLSSSSGEFLRWVRFIEPRCYGRMSLRDDRPMFPCPDCRRGVANPWSHAGFEAPRLHRRQTRFGT